MKKLGIIIDSFSSLSKKEAQNLGFEFLSLQLEADGKLYQDGILDAKEMLETVRDAKVVATSLPTLESMENAIKTQSEKYEKVLYLGINHEISSTGKYMKTFSQDFENVYVFDNHFSGYQLVYAALLAQEEYEKHQNFDLVLEKLNFLNENSQTYILPESLDYLIKGGRLKGFKKFILKTGGLIPLIEYKLSGHVMVAKLNKTVTGALKKVFNKVLELKKTFKNLEVHLISGLSEKLNSEVLELAKEFNVIVSKVCIASSVTVAHTGPNAVAIAFMPSIEEFKK
ncbi:DegV family protein [Mycoplasmopsis synoviae]|uniref:DegV family protein n=1 Tax=Mycoplasmopsis synoviae TaxID=2109 RepID=UPI001CE0EEB4|nr:DegV family protein [Mycoplasmopsis synoviae]UBX98886.1 DegV family protein [Mycoplasmopsis synoviae]